MKRNELSKEIKDMLKYEPLIGAYRRGLVPKPAERAELIMKNFKSIVKNTSTTLEVVSYFLSGLHTKEQVEKELKEIKNTLKGNSETFSRIINTVTGDLEALDIAFKAMAIAMSLGAPTVDSKHVTNWIKETLSKQLVTENGTIKIEESTQYLNNPFISREYFKTMEVGSAVFYIILSFAARGYSSLADLSMLQLEAALITSYLRRDSEPNNQESVWSYDLLKSILGNIDLIAHVSLVNSIASFTTDSKGNTVPESLVLESLIRYKDLFLSVGELHKYLSLDHEDGRIFIPAVCSKEQLADVVLKYIDNDAELVVASEKESHYFNMVNVSGSIKEVKNEEENMENKEMTNSEVTTQVESINEGKTVRDSITSMLSEKLSEAREGFMNKARSTFDNASFERLIEERDAAATKIADNWNKISKLVGDLGKKVHDDVTEVKTRASDIREASEEVSEYVTEETKEACDVKKSKYTKYYATACIGLACGAAYLVYKLLKK